MQYHYPRATTAKKRRSQAVTTAVGLAPLAPRFPDPDLITTAARDSLRKLRDSRLRIQSQQGRDLLRKLRAFPTSDLITTAVRDSLREARQIYSRWRCGPAPRLPTHHHDAVRDSLRKLRDTRPI